MTVLTATAEGGSNNATVDTATYGTDTPWDAVVAGTGTITFTTDTAAKGGVSYEVAFSASTTAQYMEWVPASASRTAAVRFYLRLAAATTGSFQFMTFHNAAGSSKQLGLELLSTGVIRVQNAVSAVVGTSTGSLSSGVWYRVEITMDNSGGTSAGAAEIRVYTADSTTPEFGLSFSLTGQNFGASSIGLMRIGRYGLLSSTATLFFDDIAYADSTTTFLGPSGYATARPDADTSNAGSWTETGADTGWEALADESDATFIESPSNPQTPCLRRHHLQTLAPGPITVETRAAATADTPATTLTVAIYQDATLIASWSHALTTTPTDYSHALTAGEAAAITDRSALYVQFDADSA